MQIFPQSDVTRQLNDVDVANAMQPGDAVAVTTADLERRPYLIQELLAVGQTVGKQLGAYLHPGAETGAAVYEVFCQALISQDAPPVTARQDARLDDPGYLFDLQLSSVVKVLVECTKGGANPLASYGNKDDDAKREIVGYSALSRRVLSLKGFKHSKNGATVDFNKCLDYLVSQNAIRPASMGENSNARGYRLEVGALLGLEVTLAKRLRNAQIAEPKAAPAETASED